MQSLHPKRKFSPEEKQQLLANLDIEVEHRSRQLEAWLTDALENFRNHHEGHPSRIPRIVLGVKMRDLEEKYNGDVQVCVRVLQMDKLVGLGAGVGEERATKKRKWLAEQGTDKESEAEGSRNVKNPKITTAATPKKKPVSNAAASTLASASRTRVVHKSPGNSRTLHRPPSRAPSPSPMKGAFRPGGGATARPVPRPTSPTKVPTTPHARRPPSVATFNPIIPKTPAYPQSNITRLPRKNESMLSMNGSPLANPYEAGALPDVMEEGEEGHGGESDSGKLKAKRSASIVVRRDPSFLTATSSKPSQSRSNSQTGFNAHSRNHSQSSVVSQPSNQPHVTPIQQRFPSSGVQVTVPTKDGFFLEFNPLMVSPGAFDDLEGITDSAKKQAREDMAHLVKEAVNKWSVA